MAFRALCRGKTEMWTHPVHSLRCGALRQVRARLIFLGLLGGVFETGSCYVAKVGGPLAPRPGF